MKEHLGREEPTAADISQLYPIEACLPQFGDRHITFHDIDCFCHRSALSTILDKFALAHFEVTKAFEHDFKQYNLSNNNIQPYEVSHHLYLINPMPRLRHTQFKGFEFVPDETKADIRAFVEKMNNTQQGIRRIRLDLLTSNVPMSTSQPAPPFGHLDFTVNGLILSDAGLALAPIIRNCSPCRADVINQIHVLNVLLEEIKNHRAQMVDKNRLVEAPSRIVRILNKGYQIHGFDNFVYKPRTASDDVECNICLCECEGMYYQMKCCNTNFHGHCLRDVMSKGPNNIAKTRQCIVCRQGLNGVVSDFKVLSIILDHFNEPVPPNPVPEIIPMIDTEEDGGYTDEESLLEDAVDIL